MTGKHALRGWTAQHNDKDASRSMLMIKLNFKTKAGVPAPFRQWSLCTITSPGIRIFFSRQDSMGFYSLAQAASGTANSISGHMHKRGLILANTASHMIKSTQSFRRTQHFTNTLSCLSIRLDCGKVEVSIWQLFCTGTFTHDYKGMVNHTENLWTEVLMATKSR